MSREWIVAALLMTCVSCGSSSSSKELDKSASRSPTMITGKGIKPFPSAVEVRLFVDSGRYGDGQPSYTKPSGTVLSDRQRAWVESLMQSRAPGDEPACFIPHHFFRYYNSMKKQVGEIAVCFCCHGVEVTKGKIRSLPSGRELSIDYPRLMEFIKSLGEPTNIECF